MVGKQLNRFEDGWVEELGEMKKIWSLCGRQKSSLRMYTKHQLKLSRRSFIFMVPDQMAGLSFLLNTYEEDQTEILAT